MKVILCDIDNCIADDEWRIPRINWQKHGDERYHDYHLLSAWDRPNKSMQQELLRRGEKIVFMTARPVAYRALTEHWLELVFQCGYPEILMRPNGHKGTSPEVKQQLLDWLTGGEYGISVQDIVHAFDDHQGVIDMYRRNGIPATRVAIHNTSAFHDPIRNIAAA